MQARTVFIWLARVSVAAIFLGACLTKIQDPESFALAVQRYRLLPGELINLVAIMLPWVELTSGLDKEWLWQDWLDAIDGAEVEDCRWTPCFDCGVCPQLGTHIQIGPTGRTLLPLSVSGH